MVNQLCHDDSGEIEAIIDLARNRLMYDFSESDVCSFLVKEGHSPEVAWFSIHAAKILMKY